MAAAAPLFVRDGYVETTMAGIALAGFLLGHGFGYGTLFFIVGTFHLIGFLAILLLGGKVSPLKTPDLLTIESQS